MPPHKLKSTLKEAGIDLEKIAASVGDLGVFAAGNSESSLGGAVVLATKGAKEATNTVANIGLLLRATGTPGVTAISGKASGFSIRSAELGPKPLVVAAQGERIAIAYGLPAATQALAADSGADARRQPRLRGSRQRPRRHADQRLRRRPGGAEAGLGPGPVRRRRLRGSQALPEKIDYLAIGSGSSGELATAKLIVGIGK